MSTLHSDHHLNTWHAGKIFDRHFKIFFSFFFFSFFLFFFFFFQKIRFDISCKLSPEETICMKFQTLFSEKEKKIYK